MMNYQLLSPPKSRLFRLLRPVLLELRILQGADVAWQQGRLLSTAAARDIPNNARSRKKISGVERKAMVEAYINEYNVMNAGKFPTASNIRKQIGGGYYKVKAILQECEYNSKLSALPTAAKNSTIGQTIQVIETSDAEVSPDCQVSDDRIAVVEEFGIPADCDSSRKVVVDKNSCEGMVDTPTLNKDSAITTEYVSWSEREIDLELGGLCGTSIESNILETQEVPVVENNVENTMANENLMALAMDDSELSLKQGHHFEVTGTLRTPEPEEINNGADQAFESVNFTRCRVMPVGIVSTVIDNKKLVGDSCYNDSAIQDLDDSMVEAELNKTSAVERTLDCQVRVGKTATVDDYQVSDGKDSSSQKEVDDYSCKRMMDTSISIKNKEVTAEDVCNSEKVIDLELTSEHNKTCSTYVEGGEHKRSLGSREVSQKSILYKETSAAKSFKATETEDCEFSVKSSYPSVKSSYPSEVPGALQNSEIGEIDAAFAQASKFGEISRVTRAAKTQDTELQKSSLWGNLKFLASSMISFWRKT